MISHAHIYGRMGDSRAHIYTPITAVVSVPVSAGVPGGGSWKQSNENWKKKRDAIALRRDDEDIIFITTMFLTINKGY